MCHLVLATDAERGPSRAWYPMVLLRPPFRQQRIAHGTREGDIHHSPDVHVPNLGVAKPEFPARELVRMRCHSRPVGHFPLQLLDLPDHRKLLAFSMSEQCA